MKKLIAAVLLVGMVLTPPARSNENAELGLAYAEAQARNTEELKRYRWDTHTTLEGGEGEEFEVTVANRLNEKGELVREVKDSDSNVRRKRGLRGRAQRGAMADLDQLLEKIAGLMGTYLFMSKGQEVDFFDKAKITDGEGDLEGTRRVQAADVSVEGDRVTKWIDPGTLHPRRVDFEATVDGHAVTGEIMYRPIEDGPNVPRLATIEIADLEGKIETEFLDYKAQL